MVLHHMQKLLEFGQACCRFTCTSVGSTFAIVASFWYLSRGSSTTYLGFMRLASTHILDRGERSGLDDVVELTLSFMCQFLPQVLSNCVHIVFLAPPPWNVLATCVQAWLDLVNGRERKLLASRLDRPHSQRRRRSFHSLELRVFWSAAVPPFWAVHLALGVAAWICVWYCP